MENRNEVKIGEGTYIVERSFTPGKSVKDLLVQRLISEKKKDDAKKNDDFTEIHKGRIVPKGQKRLNTAGVQPFLVVVMIPASCNLYLTEL